MYQRDTLTSFLNSFGVMYATKDADDIPEIAIMSEHGSDILDQN
jgi:hypothetical protein